MTNTSSRMTCILAVCLVIANFSSASAEEIYSNTTGGGAWSEGATWLGGKVPGPDDDVVISKDDVIDFDRDDDGKTSCRNLALDPRALLQFKMNSGRIVMTVNGLIDNYGYIRMDASKSSKDHHELRLVAEDPEQRMLKTSQGGGLIVAGRGGLSKSRRNAVLISQPPVEEVPAGSPPVDPTAIVESATGTTLDIQRTNLINIYVQATGIDNTGAKPGERINVLRNHFTGTSRLNATSCDSAIIADNLFERDDPFPVPQPAVYLSASPLLEFRGNTIRGNYPTGVTCYGQNDSTMTNTLVEKCATGVYWYGSGFMIKNLHIRDCPHGLTLTSAAGTVEDVLIEKSQTGYYQNLSIIQMTNLDIRDMQPHPQGYKIYISDDQLTLINSPITPEDITIPPNFEPAPIVEGKPRLPAVQMLYYVVVQVDGQVPPEVAVEFKSANLPEPLPPGAQDPNVRNSPAPVLKNSLTPFPRTLEPLIVRGWHLDADAKPQPAPQYQVNIVGPIIGENGERKILKTLTVTPEPGWYRADANEKKPTLEVTLP
ncbi:MAG: right-handed parallel beta-helix repeat-containing protein [Planctomycetota bacterium]|nr:right-handed parallel beta-helix repeat-containing protein [Planctomycetota bacterium]MDA1211263.1 right-handed parallel beta-helix repeat-containing protein [Planctomycetota bacterium]